MLAANCCFLKKQTAAVKDTSAQMILFIYNIVMREQLKGWSLASCRLLMTLSIQDWYRIGRMAGILNTDTTHNNAHNTQTKWKQNEQTSLNTPASIFYPRFMCSSSGTLQWHNISVTGRSAKSKVSDETPVIWHQPQKASQLSDIMRNGPVSHCYQLRWISRHTYRTNHMAQERCLSQMNFLQLQRQAILADGLEDLTQVSQGAS